MRRSHQKKERTKMAAVPVQFNVKRMQHITTTLRDRASFGEHGITRLFIAQPRNRSFRTLVSRHTITATSGAAHKRRIYMYICEIGKHIAV